jgi:hypothetical protein
MEKKCWFRWPRGQRKWRPSPSYSGKKKRQVAKGLALTLE